jgi:ADP-ribose pyrophosphatase YjhB (NUDIX family)
LSIKEETNLDVKLKHLLGVYSEPERDPRGHMVSGVFVAEGKKEPKAKDDALDLKIFTRNALPRNLAFDHEIILNDYFQRQLK